MIKKSIKSTLQPFSFLLGCLSFLLGVIVLYGWFTNNIVLTKVNPNFVQMQFNTALGFLISGIGLVALNLGWTRTAQILGGVLVALGGLTLIEYAGINLRIDEIFMKHPVDELTSHPGRMAPNTALCFLLFGLSLISFRFNIKGKVVSGRSVFFSALALALGTVSFFGYISNVETAYGWGNYTRMAIHTAAGFIVLGIGGVLHSTFLNLKFSNRMPHWLPLLTGIFSFTITLCLWQAFTSNQIRQVRLKTLNVQQSIHKILLSQMNSQIEALVRMGKRWEYQNGTPHEQWKKDAQYYVDHFKVYQAIKWVDSSFVVRWSVPEINDESRINSELFRIPAYKSVLDSVRMLKVPRLTPPFKLEKGGTGVSYYVPLSDKNISSGFIVGIFNLQKFFEESLKGFAYGYQIRMYYDEQLLYSRIGSAEKELDARYSSLSNLTLGVLWTTEVTPTLETLEEYRSNLPLIVLILGTLISILTFLLFKSFQKTSLMYHQTVTSNQQLTELSQGFKNQVVEIERARLAALNIAKDAEESKKQVEALAEELERSNKDLEQFAYVASHDLKAPLRSIGNLAKWLEEDLKEYLVGDPKENMALLRGRVARLESLLDDLLSYSRAGRQEEKECLVDTKKLIEELTSLFENGSKKITVSISKNMPIFRTQKAALELILRNLISNAIKHTDKEEVHLEVSSYEEKGFCMFSVKDDGPGIPPEYHERIFEMFKTLKPRDEVEGSGMGLAIIKKIVERQNGVIRVNSQSGMRGTEFSFSWKIAENKGLIEA